MVSLLSTRRFYGFIAFASFALLGVAFYMEYQMGLEPCPLCMLQRIVFFFVGVFSLITFFIGKVRIRRYMSWVIIVLSCIGAALAIRHLYLQHIPESELPACLPGLSYMLDVFPWQDIMRAMIMGTGECGQVVWTFLGLSIPGWTLVIFSGIALSNLIIVFRKTNVL